MAEVVADGDRLGQILVEPQPTRDAARNARGLERVRQPRAEMIALGIDEDLRLEPEAAKRLRVDDAVAVALKRRPKPALFVGKLPPARLVRAHRERREPALLVLANGLGKAVGDLSGDLGHQSQGSP